MSIFLQVLFPLLTKLLDNISPADVGGMEETRMRACTLLSKVWPRISLLFNPNLNLNELKVGYADYFICVSDFDKCFWSPQVFLQHLSPLLSLPTFAALWLTILDFMDKYMHAGSSDLLVR